MGDLKATVAFDMDGAKRAIDEALGLIENVPMLREDAESIIIKAIQPYIRVAVAEEEDV
ncbi:MAG: hypothetical protein ACYCOR_10905 [Acidobacteriaceae bacterium]